MNLNIFRHNRLALTAAAAGVLVSLLAWLWADRYVSRRELERFEYRAKETVDAVIHELHNHEHILLGAAGIFNLAGRVTRKEWKVYVQSMQLDVDSHSVQGLGYAPFLKQADLAEHVRKGRSEDYPGYAVRPHGERREYAPILYLEPLTERNRTFLGYDMLSGPARRSVMERARDTGRASLMVNAGPGVRPGLLMFVPLYLKGSPSGTVGERQAALRAYVFSAFNAKEFLNGIFPDGPPFTYLQIFEGRGTESGALLVDSFHNGEGAPPTVRNITKEIVMELGGQPWTFLFSAMPAFISRTERSLPWIVLCSGLVISMAFGLLVLADGITRDKARKLKLSEANLSATLRSIGDGVIGADTEGRVTVLNTVAEYLTGWSQEEARGRPVHEILHAVDEKTKDPFSWPLNDVLATGEVGTFKAQLLLVARDGSEYAIDSIAAPIRDDLGFATGVVLVFRDVTDQRRAVQMLEDERKRLANIIEGTNVGTWEWQIQTGAVVFNERWAEIAGFTLEELAPLTIETWSRMIHPDDLEVGQALLARHIEGELDYFIHEPRMKHKNGSWIWTLDRGKVTAWTDDGKPLVMYGTHQDITVRKIMEQELRKVSFAVENSPAAVVITNAGAIIEYVNPKFTQITGYSAEEVIGKNPRILKSGVHSREFYKDMWAALTAGQEWRGKLFNKKKNGDYFWESASISSISNEAGKITHYVAIKEDITRQVQMENALRQTRERLDRSQEIAHLGSWELDLSKNELFWSDEVFRIFGLEPSEALLTYEFFLGHVHPDDRKALESGYFTSVSRGEEFFETEHRIVRKTSGEVRWVLEKCSHVRNGEGTIVRSVGMIQDISDRKWGEIALKKAIESSEAANRAKSDFLASMNHELRTPLNVVIGFSEVLAERMYGELNEKQAKCAENILNAGRRLLGLINDILDLSKIESGKMDFERVKVPVKGLLENSLTLVKEKAYKHNLKLKVSAADGMVVQADERMLKQVMFNLLSNAVKFTPYGGAVDVTAEVVGADRISNLPGEGAHPPEERWLRISVSDTGIGIKAEDQDRLFRTFEQLDTGSGRKYQGTGLGLSLCQRFVEMHGGRIWAESEGEGKGSTFRFVIPLDPMKSR